MKKSDYIYIIIVSLLLGLTLGLVCPKKCSIAFRTTLHKIYIKFHPESQKDTKTIIIERATKDTPNLPQYDIFEEPTKKENSFIKYIKKIFIKKDNEQSQSIHDVILH
ncbi:MAG: hypothetical protein NC200_05880 [Candidatus Gastranaerophilales bacterium]|nr:hypothetical protein [Candidatus Gastranaerophilales bacterium]